MKLAKRFATITSASAAALLIGAGGAHAQGEGGLLSLLGNPSIVLACFPSGQVGQGNTFSGTQNINCSQSASTTTNPPAPNGGITGYEVVPGGGFTVSDGVTVGGTVACPAGKRVLSGGVNITSGFSSDLRITTSGPNPAGTNWRLGVAGVDDPVSGEFYAICANAVA
ncbi:hypothetical protein ABZ070_34590 [Streptomyces sp. NPDC006283]|uniref:hypothetical protein n=1 Tax=Streptomyces sp. NPDC006283 TaxID=3156741 RepID=UPI0033ACE776